MGNHMSKQESEAQAVPAIYPAIQSVMRDLFEAGGISKGEFNKEQKYYFRGIDDVFNALAPLLIKNNIIVLPRVQSVKTEAHKTARGSNLFYTYVEVEYDFISTLDASKHTISMVGEGMDVSDKSSNKAMSAAYKYACFQAFCISTEGGMIDSERDTHVTGNAAEQTRAHQANTGSRRAANESVNDAEIIRSVTQTLWAAAHKGHEALNQAWKSIGPCPARDAIEKNVKLMASFQAATKKADHAMGRMQSADAGVA